MSFAKKGCLACDVFLIVTVLFLSCVHDTSINIESDAVLQLLDFFEKQNTLVERQKKYEFQEIVGLKRLGRKKAEVTIQYLLIDKYLTVDRTTELKRSTFLLEWRDEGKLVVPPEGDAKRVHWVLTKTWDYRPGEDESSF
jgi:hypothetical protein